MEHLFFIIPLFCVLVTQALKVVIEGLSGRRFSLRPLFRMGGMPSSHSALVASAVVVSFILEGAASGAFVISVGMAFLVVRDAVGLRMKIEQFSQATARALEAEGRQKADPLLKERFGHKPLEIAIGAAIGIFLSLALASLFA